jgi:hypothetical protein
MYGYRLDKITCVREEVPVLVIGATGATIDSTRLHPFDGIVLVR